MAISVTLATTLGRPGGFLSTSAAFARLAQAASRRLVVMSPFIDAGGFRWLRRVFEAAPAECEKIVVLRNADHYTVELGVQNADWLRALALQLPFLKSSESMDDHDSEIVGAASVD